MPCSWHNPWGLWVTFSAFPPCPSLCTISTSRVAADRPGHPRPEHDCWGAARRLASRTAGEGAQTQRSKHKVKRPCSFWRKCFCRQPAVTSLTPNDSHRGNDVLRQVPKGMTFGLISSVSQKAPGRGIPAGSPASRAPAAAEGRHMATILVTVARTKASGLLPWTTRGAGETGITTDAGRRRGQHSLGWHGSGTQDTGRTRGGHSLACQEVRAGLAQAKGPAGQRPRSEQVLLGA